MRFLQSFYVFITSWLSRFVSPIKRFHRVEQGQGMVEYALILALIAIVVVATLVALGGEIDGKFNEIIDGFTPPA